VPEKVSAILQGSDFSCAIKSCKMLSLWPQIVDENVRKNTEPVKIKNGTLYISTSAPAWAQELTFLKREIIKKFNQAAGEEAIADIVFGAKNFNELRRRD